MTTPRASADSRLLRRSSQRLTQVRDGVRRAVADMSGSVAGEWPTPTNLAG